MNPKKLLLAVIGAVIVFMILVVLLMPGGKPERAPVTAQDVTPAPVEQVSQNTNEDLFDSLMAGEEGEDAGELSELDMESGAGAMTTDLDAMAPEASSPPASSELVMDHDRRISTLEAQVQELLGAAAQREKELVAAREAQEARANRAAREAAAARQQATRVRTPPTPTPPPPLPRIALTQVTSDGQTVRATIDMGSALPNAVLAASGPKMATYRFIGEVDLMPARDSAHGITFNLTRESGVPVLVVESANNIDTDSSRAGSQMVVTARQDVPLGMQSDQRWVIRAILPDSAAIMQPSTGAIVTVSVGSMIAGYGLVTNIDPETRVVTTERGLLHFTR